MTDRIDPRTGELVTTHYGWTKPNVAGSPDAWGGYINANYDALDGQLWNVSAAQSGYLLLTGGTVTGTLSAKLIAVAPASGWAVLNLNAIAGQGRQLTGYTVNSPRWSVIVGNGAAEAAGNVGSDFQILSYDNSGNFLTAPFQITRSTSIASFSQPIVNGSDRRMKSNIEPVTDALAIVGKLQGVFYKHKDADRRQVGLVAQDVASALPEVVFSVGEEPDAMLGVAYPNIVAVLINAVKELSAKVAALEAK